MPRVPDKLELELVLRIDLEADPVTGSLTTLGGRVHFFSGWIGFAAALERIRAEGSDRAKTPRGGS